MSHELTLTLHELTLTNSTRTHSHSTRTQLSFIIFLLFDELWMSEGWSYVYLFQGYVLVLVINMFISFILWPDVPCSFDEQVQILKDQGGEEALALVSRDSQASLGFFRLPSVMMKSSKPKSNNYGSTSVELVERKVNILTHTPSFSKFPKMPSIKAHSDSAGIRDKGVFSVPQTPSSPITKANSFSVTVVPSVTACVSLERSKRSSGREVDETFLSHNVTSSTASYATGSNVVHNSAWLDNQDSVSVSLLGKTAGSNDASRSSNTDTQSFSDSRNDTANETASSNTGDAGTVGLDIDEHLSQPEMIQSESTNISTQSSPERTANLPETVECRLRPLHYNEHTATAAMDIQFPLLIDEVFSD